jgi:hypothetical protein
MHPSAVLEDAFGTYRSSSCVTKADMTPYNVVEEHGAPNLVAQVRIVRLLLMRVLNRNCLRTKSNTC